MFCVYDMPYSLARNILWHGLWTWQTIWWPCWSVFSREQEQGRNQPLREKLKHWGLSNIFQNNICPEIPWNSRRSWGRPCYIENVMSNMELRPPLFPFSVCLGSNGDDSHWTLYLSRLKNVVFQDMSRSTSNTNERLKSFLYEEQRIQFLLKMNCQHCRSVSGFVWHTEISVWWQSLCAGVSGHEKRIFGIYYFRENETGFLAG